MTQDFDLILMDIQMPVLDGVSATKMLRSTGFERPIVALTANVMAEDVAHYLRSGFTHCIGKPIPFDALGRLLGELLAKDSQGTETRFSLESLADFADIKRQFEQTLPGRLHQLADDVAGGNWPAVAAVAHGLKGSAGSFGYAGVTEVARELEIAARRGEAGAAQALMDRLAALEELQNLPIPKTGTDDEQH